MKRAFVVGGLLVLAGWLAAGLITLPEVGAGIWVDYAAAPLVLVLALLAYRWSDTEPVLAWLGLAARLAVGGMWIWAGLVKLPDPASSVESVRAYALLPESLVEPVGYLLPVVEVVLGVALVLGLMTRGAALLSAGLLLVFIGGIISVWARGMEINCGCFGDGGANPDAALQYPWEISRDLALLGLAVALVALRRTRYALDGLLFRSRVRLADFLEAHHEHHHEHDHEHEHDTAPSKGPSA